jgi:hypothetical protein
MRFVILIFLRTKNEHFYLFYLMQTSTERVRDLLKGISHYNLATATLSTAIDAQAAQNEPTGEIRSH